MAYGSVVQGLPLYDPDTVRKPVSSAWIFFVIIWAASCVSGALVAAMVHEPILGMLIAGLPTVFGVAMKPSFAVCCITVMLPLGSVLSYQGNLSGDRVVGGLATLGILVHCLVVRKGIHAKGSPLLPIFLIACLGTLSILWAPYQAPAIVQSITLLQLVFYNLAVWNALVYGEDVIWPLRCYAGSTLMMGCWLLMTNSLVAHTRTDERLTISITETANPADFAVLLGAAFFVSVYLVLRDPAKWLRPLWLASAPLPVALMIMTGSRGPLVGLAAGIGATFLSVRSVRQSKALLVGCVLMMLLVGGGIYGAAESGLITSSTLKRLTKTEKRGAAFEDRVWLATQGLENIVERPFTGVGLGNFRYHVQTAVAHVDIVHLGTELGIFAMICYVWFLSKQVAGVIKTKSPYERWFLAIMTAFLAVSACGHVIYFRKVYHFFMFAAAAIAYRTRIAEETQQAAYAAYLQSAAAPYPRANQVTYSVPLGRQS